MKKLLYLLLVFSSAVTGQVKISDMPTHNGSKAGVYFPVIVGGANRKYDLNNLVSKTDTTLTNRLRQSDTSNIKPRLKAGANVSITGTYPNLTISSTGAGGGSATLYSTTGNNTDGSMTQSATTSALAGKLNTGDTIPLSNRLTANTNATNTSIANEITARTNAVALKLNISDTAGIRLRPVAGTNMSISGTYPNLTFSSVGGGGGSTPLYSTTGSNADGAMTQSATTAELNLRATTSALATTNTTVGTKKNITDSLHTIGNHYVRQDRMKMVVDSATQDKATTSQLYSRVDSVFNANPFSFANADGTGDSLFTFTSSGAKAKRFNTSGNAYVVTDANNFSIVIGGLIHTLGNVDYTILASDNTLILPEVANNRVLTLPAASTMPNQEKNISCRATTAGRWTLSGSFVRKNTTGTDPIAEDFVNAALINGANYHLKSDGIKWYDISN